jgi:hypothetical protein
MDGVYAFINFPFAKIPVLLNLGPGKGGKVV